MSPCKNVDDVIRKLCKDKTQLENAVYDSLYSRCEGSFVATTFDNIGTLVLVVYESTILGEELSSRKDNNKLSGDGDGTGKGVSSTKSE